jgi:plastocyanin
MHFHSVLSSTLLAAAAVSAKTINIKVGESGLTFSPNSTTAEVGDQVVFTFYPQDHNVVQATFADPCQAMAGGFYSGFQSTKSGPAPMSFELTINSTTPIWYFCGQGKHCESGMVGVINVA